MADDVIKQLCGDGLSANAISRVIGCSRRTVDRAILRLGIERDARSLIAKYKVDTEFFASIDNECKAYWLGFLLADGSLVRRNDHGVQLRILSVALSPKDIDHLELFRCHIGAEQPIRRYNGVYEYVKLSICCQVLARDLIHHGWDEFKLNGKWPKIDKNLDRHVLRGLFDGDGWISRSINNGHARPEVGLCCPHREPLIKALDILGITANIITDMHDNSTKILWKWRKSGRTCLDIYHVLYDNSTVWLPRKRAYLELML